MREIDNQMGYGAAIQGVSTLTAIYHTVRDVKYLIVHFPSVVALEMILLLLLLIEPLDTASSTSDGQLLPISSATAKTVYQNNPPESAIDGSPSTFYHSNSGSEPEWLKLQLEEPALVSRVVIVNRLFISLKVIRRLLGTRVYLYDADGTTQIADCGKITEVDTENRADLTSQTYTLPCDTSQLASYVKLEDSEIAVGYDGSAIIMNIAEVKVYGTIWKSGRRKKTRYSRTPIYRNPDLPGGFIPPIFFGKFLKFCRLVNLHLQFARSNGDHVSVRFEPSN
eukprot:sb/3467878/